MESDTALNISRAGDRYRHCHPEQGWTKHSLQPSNNPEVVLLFPTTTDEVQN